MVKMKKILFTILVLAGTNISAVTTFSATTTTKTGSVATANNDLTQITSLQTEIDKLKAENTSLESENKEIEDEATKIKKQKGIFIGTTALGTVGTGAGATFWWKNRKGKKEKEGDLDKAKKVAECMKKYPAKFSAVSACSTLTKESKLDEVLKCYDKLPAECKKTAKKK